jgi:hypothetical protein
MYREYEVSASDIKGAFLHAQIPSEVEIYVKITKGDHTALEMMYLHANKFINKDGSAYYRLNKYLHGLEEAPYDFNKLLDTKLKTLGFQQ